MCDLEADMPFCQGQLLVIYTQISVLDMKVFGTRDQRTHELFGFPGHSTVTSGRQSPDFHACLDQGVSPFPVQHLNKMLAGHNFAHTRIHRGPHTQMSTQTNTCVST